MITALRTFAAHRWGRFSDRAHVAAHQAALLARFRSEVMPRSPFYAPLTDRPLDDLPAMDRDRMMAAFAAINTAGLSRADAEALARAAEPDAVGPTRTASGIAAGFSTGTSGRHGLFLTSPAERRIWAAALLGRFWPRPALRQQRIALFLRADNRLYAALNALVVRLSFFDAAQPVEAHLRDVLALAPTVIAGPTSVLLQLAEALEAAGKRLRPTTVLCGAEPAEPQDLARLHAAFGIRPDIIYQCTEGVLAMTCPHGSLHLNERHVVFRREIVDPVSGAFVPIISDLTRSSLPVLNYRLDDVLVPEPAPCPCGCASARLKRVEGRLADAIFLPRPAGGRRWISSETLRQIAFALPGATDWALHQTGRQRLHYFVAGNIPADARARLQGLCHDMAARMGTVLPQVQLSNALPPGDQIKRRRLRVLP